MKMDFKKIVKVGLILAMVVYFSSCNRGGVGCPYELNAGLDLLNLIR
jgi:hypothetical protein